MTMFNVSFFQFCVMYDTLLVNKLGPFFYMQLLLRFACISSLLETMQYFYKFAIRREIFSSTNFIGVMKANYIVCIAT